MEQQSKRDPRFADSYQTFGRVYPDVKPDAERVAEVERWAAETGRRIYPTSIRVLTMPDGRQKVRCEARNG